MPLHARLVPVATAGDGGVPFSNGPLLQPTGRGISLLYKPRDVTRLKKWLKDSGQIVDWCLSYVGSVCWNTTDNSFAGTKIGNYRIQAAGTSFSAIYQWDGTKDNNMGKVEISLCVKCVRKLCFLRRRSRSSSEIRVCGYCSNMTDIWAVVWALVWDISRPYGALGRDKALRLSPDTGNPTPSNLCRSNQVIQETISTCAFKEGERGQRNPSIYDF